MKTWVQNNFWLFFCGLFAFVGTVFGAVAVGFWHNSEQLVRTGVAAEGTVVRLVYNEKSGTAAPVIEYETDWAGRQTHISSTFSSPPAYHVGEHVRLWYDADDPTQVVLSGSDRWLLPAIFGGFFLIFGGIGYGGLAGQFFKSRRRRWLAAHGHPVEATLLGVLHNTSVRVNGASPFVVQCQWHDPLQHRVHVFESDPLWFNPANFLPPNRPLRVLIDPRNPKSYLVDLSFLPSVA